MTQTQFSGHSLQEHLSTVFRALDQNLLYAGSASFADDAYAAASFADDAYTASFADDAYAAGSAAARAASFAAAADAAAYAAATAAVFVTDDDAARIAVDAAVFAAAAGDGDAYKKLLLILIQNLKNSKPLSYSTAMYGPIWTNFQKALKDHNCGYWADLYQRAFDNNFVFDREELERRINVPQEIWDQGAARVGEYLQKLKKGARRLNQARIIILGDKGVGKTCLARRLVKPDAEMTTKAESTAGVDTSLWPIKAGGEEIQVSIWDFAGHTVTHAVHQFFLSERCLYIMVYNGRTDARERLTYWLDHMKNFGGDSKAIILINKHDPHKVKVPINFLKEQYPIAGFYEFSVRDDIDELEAFRSVVSDYIRNNPSWEKQEIPESYYQVKADLEDIFQKGNKKKGQEFIKRSKFEAIAKKHGVEDPDQLLADLHALGVSLWYEGMGDFGMLVLNPEWISEGVYKIINWVSNNQKYSLALNEFEAVFKKESKRYPEGKYEFLFSLMKHYELAYQRTDQARLIIPHLLKEDRPQQLPEFLIGESLRLQYKADQSLPPNTISRFIVRHHKQIKKGDTVWRFGVILQDEKGSIALIREEDRTISVSVKGPDQSTFIARLRDTLNDIFDSYKSKKPTLEYRIDRWGKIPAQPEQSGELYLPESKIANHVALDRPYFDDETNQLIPLNNQASIYNITIHTQNAVLGRVENFNQNTFNFHECNIGLQASLNELAMVLQLDGHHKEAKRLADTAKVLELTEGAKSKEEVKKKGIVNWLKKVTEELGDKDSKLYKVVTGIERGVTIAQDIAKRYNSIAEWVGIPVVPKALLGQKDKDKEEDEPKEA